MEGGRESEGDAPYGVELFGLDSTTMEPFNATSLLSLSAPKFPPHNVQLHSRIPCYIISLDAVLFIHSLDSKPHCEAVKELPVK